MQRLKVAVIGHVALDTGPIDFKGKSDRTTVLNLYNYLRVVDENEQLVDHLDHLAARRGRGERFSIWDIRLSSALLIGAHLRRHGAEVRTINSVTADNAARIAEELRAFAPDMVALSTTFVLARQQFLRNCAWLREALPGTFVVAGGQHVSTTLMYMSQEQQKEYLLATDIDVMINDTQGEKTLLDVYRARAGGGGLESLPNLVLKAADGGAVVTPRLPENNDINWTLMDYEEVPPGSVVHMRTARSCSFKCAFCTYPSIAGDLALMDLDNAVATFRRAKEMGAHSVVFSDDTFNVPPDRFEKLLDRLIAEDFRLPWYSFLRCQYLTEPLADKMLRSGCAGVFLGVESGSDLILKYMKKGAVARYYRDGIRWMRERGIKTVGAFVAGFPGETQETLAETRNFIETSGIEYYFMQPFFYQHHAPIHKRAKEFGLTGNGLFWSHNTMNWRQAVEEINRTFMEVTASTFINPDFNLWEYAYLRSRGLSDAEFQAYREDVNALTRRQMTRYGLVTAAKEPEFVGGIISPRQA